MKNFNNIKISEGGREETFNIPNNGEVYNANYRDDIVEQAEAEEKQIGDFIPYDNEEKFDSTKLEESAEAERRIGAFRRAAKLRGHKVYRLMELSTIVRQ